MTERIDAIDMAADTQGMERPWDAEDMGWGRRTALWLLCLGVLVFGAWFALGGKREFSESENRYLAKWPEMSAESLRSGNYTAGVETYVADQFPLRDAFLGMRTEAERISGRREIEGVYLATDGSLIEAYTPPRDIDRIVTQLTRLAENVTDARVSVMLVPTAVSVYADRLPAYAPDATAMAAQESATAMAAEEAATVVAAQESATTLVAEEAATAMAAGRTQAADIARIYAALPEDVVRIDALDPLLAAGRGDDRERGMGCDMPPRLYYRTDHHWTTDGAYLAYLAYCDALSLGSIPLSHYSAATVAEDFRGTVYSKLNDPWYGQDTITAYTDPDWALTVVYEDTGEVTDSPYNADYLTKKDKYSYFLNNIHSLITITNEAAPEGAIAVVKDSYANSFVPFLLAHYRRVYVFDTRYYRGGVSSFVNEHPEITEVLVLYNMNTIGTDAGVGGIY